MSVSPSQSPALATHAPHLGAPPGLLYGIGAYTLWGVFPLYFRTVAHVKPWVVLCHRVVWSVLFLAVVISVRREWPPVIALFRDSRKVLLLLLGAVLIASNWLIFIYAVGSGQVLEASLGYFINPLVSIALGTLFLRERLRKLQWIAVTIAGLGVANMALRGAGLPWIALLLATTFAFYGFVRKRVDANSLHGLLVETGLLLPLAGLVLALSPNATLSIRTWGLLSLSGVITAVPLLLFGAAVRTLPLSTIGFLQYIGPTLQFLVATVLLGEPLNSVKLASFGFCWLAIGVYVTEALLSRRPQPIEEPD